MPRHDYICRECGVRFEQQVAWNADPSRTVCPHGHQQVQRLLSAPAVVFKGSGWYSTDHPRPPSASAGGTSE